MKKTKEKSEIVALSKIPVPGKGKHRVVRISSDTEGFRRAGLKHSKIAIDHPAENITDAQFDQLVAEPKLTVEVVDLADEDEPKK